MGSLIARALAISAAFQACAAWARLAACKKGYFLPFSKFRASDRFALVFALKRTGRFRPDYVTLDHHCAQNRTFGFAPIPVIQEASAAPP